MPIEEIDRKRAPQRSLEILGKEDIDRLQGILDKNFGGEFDLKNYGVMLGSEERIWIASKDVFLFEFGRLPVNSVGINFGKMKRNEKFRLTIEGAQMVGRTAERNIAKVKDEDAEKFLRGEDIIAIENVKCDEHNFVLVKTLSGRIIGSAMIAEGLLKNFLPKSRRIR